MIEDFDSKKYFQKQLENACKGTPVTPRELLRELLNSGYKNLYSGELSTDELEMTVADLVESKEISGATNSKRGKASNTIESEELEIEEDENVEESN